VLQQSAVTERNSLGFEDFRKRTNEIRKCHCRCLYKVQNNDIVKGAFIEGNIQQCYGILPENFDVVKSFTVCYVGGQAFSVLSCRKSTFFFLQLTASVV